MLRHVVNLVIAHIWSDSDPFLSDIFDAVIHVLTFSMLYLTVGLHDRHATVITAHYSHAENAAVSI